MLDREAYSPSGDGGAEAALEQQQSRQQENPPMVLAPPANPTEELREMQSRLTDTGNTLLTRMGKTAGALKYMENLSVGNRGAASLVARPGPSLQRVSVTPEAIEHHAIKGAIVAELARDCCSPLVCL